MSGKIPCLVEGASLLSFSLFWRPVLKKKRMDFADEEFSLALFRAIVLYFLEYLLDVA